MTDSWELAETVRDALRAITDGGVTLLSTVEVATASLEEILVGGVRLPAAIVRVGPETHAADVRSSSQEIEVQLIAQADADRFGSGAVLGHGSIKGVLELQQLVYTALSTSLDGDGTPVTAWSASETEVVDVGDGRRIAMRALLFAIEAKGGAFASPIIAITYGSTTFNASSTLIPRGMPRVFWDAGEQTVEFSCSFDAAADAATLQTACATAVGILTARSSLLTVTVGGQTQHSWSPASGTAGWAGATLEQVGERDSPTFRQYRWTVRYYLTAAAASFTNLPGLAAGQITYRRTPSQRIEVTLSGDVRRLPGQTPSSATTAYLASIATWAAAVIGATFSAYRLEGEDYEYDERDDALRFTRLYREVLSGQSPAPVTHASVSEQAYEVEVAEGISAGVGLLGEATPRGKTVSCTWSASVLKTETDLRAFYAANVRASLLEAMTAAAAGTVYLDAGGERVSVDAGDSRLSVSLSGFAPGAPIVSAEVTVSILAGAGVLLSPRASGQAHDYTEMPTDQTCARNVTARIRLASPPASVSSLWATGGVARAVAVADAWTAPALGSAEFCAARLVGLPEEASEEEITGPYWQQVGDAILSVTPVEVDGNVWTDLSVSAEQILVVSGKRIAKGTAPGWDDRVRS